MPTFLLDALRRAVHSTTGAARPQARRLKHGANWNALGLVPPLDRRWADRFMRKPGNSGTLYGLPIPLCRHRGLP